MKKFTKAILILFVAFLFTTNVYAASGSILASTGTKVAAVGSTFVVTVTASCSEPLGTWQFGISYDSAYVSFVSGSPLNVVGYTTNGTSKTQSYSYTFKAVKAGNANIRVTGVSMAGYNEEKLFTPSSNSVSVTVKTQAEIQASYSKNNDLKALSVEGYELTPEFDKDTLEYKVSVPDTETAIKVNASVADSTARVTGTGTIDISEGANKIEVVVTAQNGGTKTYTIIVDVKDLNPINVSVDGKDYSVVKKEDLLTAPVGFSPTVLTMNEIEIPAFKSELVGITLVGLKDESGDVGLYIYDEDSKTYTEYKELRGNGITLYSEVTDDVPKGFKKATVEINGNDYAGFVSEKDESFIVLYAMNIETGQMDYYVYDSDTNGFIKYNAKVFETLLKESEEYKIIMFGAGAVAILLFLIALLEKSKVSKLKKMIKRFSLRQSEEVERQRETERTDFTDDIVQTYSSYDEDNSVENTQSYSSVSDDEPSPSVQENDDFDDEDEDFLGNKKKKKKKKR